MRSTPARRPAFAIALIGLMVYSFARVNGALGMKVEDAFIQNRRFWVRLNEKGGKRHEMPCRHNLEAYLHGKRSLSGLLRIPTKSSGISDVKSPIIPK